MYSGSGEKAQLVMGICTSSIEIATEVLSRDCSGTYAEAQKVSVTGSQGKNVQPYPRS